MSNFTILSIDKGFLSIGWGKCQIVSNPVSLSIWGEFVNSVAATKGYELGELGDAGASNEFGMMMMLMMVLRLMMMVMMMVFLMGVSNEFGANAKYENVQIRPNKPIQCILAKFRYTCCW